MDALQPTSPLLRQGNLSSTLRLTSTETLKDYFSSHVVSDSSLLADMLICLSDASVNEALVFDKVPEKFQFIFKKENRTASYQTLLRVAGEASRQKEEYQLAASYFQKACDSMSGVKGLSPEAAKLYEEGTTCLSNEDYKKAATSFRSAIFSGEQAQEATTTTSTKNSEFQTGKMPEKSITDYVLPSMDAYEVKKFVKFLKKHPEATSSLDAAIQSTNAGEKAHHYAAVADLLNSHNRENKRYFDKLAYQNARESEKNRDPRGLRVLGNFYLLGEYRLNLQRDVIAAEFYFKEAAQKGDSYAKYQLAKMHLDCAYKAPQMGKKIIQLLTEAANDNQVGALALLGQLYFAGKLALNIEINKNVAVSYLLKAAELNDRQSIKLVATHYQSEATKQGGSALLHNLGMYLYSVCNDNTTDETKKWMQDFFRIAAAKGNPDSAYQLAKILLSSEKKEENAEAIVRLLVQASQGNVREAIFLLGKFYVNGNTELGLSKDIELAKEYLIPLANSGHGNAQYIVGTLFLAQCKEKYQGDMSTLEKSQACHNDPELKYLFTLARGYLEKFVEKTSFSSEYYHMAYYQLAMLYPTTDTKYEKLLQNAQSLEHCPGAYYRLGLLYRATHQDRAIKKFQAVSGKHAYAAFELAQIYESKIETIAILEETRIKKKHNIAEAIRYYRLAEKQGHPEALQALQRLQRKHGSSEDVKNASGL